MQNKTNNIMIEPIITLSVETTSYPQFQLNFLVETTEEGMITDKKWVMLNKIKKEIGTTNSVTEFIADNHRWIYKNFLKLVLARYFELLCITDSGEPVYVYVPKNEDDSEVLNMLREEFGKDELYETICMFKYLHDSKIIKLKKKLLTLISTALEM